MVYSEMCGNSSTYWNGKECVPCDVKPGHDVTPNCGRNDHGGYHDDAHTKCKPNTFNDGSGPYCRNCSSCKPGNFIEKNCTTTTDTVCSELRTTTIPVTTQTHQSFLTSQQDNASPKVSVAFWALPVVFFMLLITCTLLILRMKGKRGQCTKMCFKKRPSFANQAFHPIAFAAGDNDLEDLLNENIRSAPLQTVLDNLDVLEELVILLDPDTRGLKNTKHLASHCSFPSTWITYTYSMKDSKSPLRAVLEGLTSRNPDWTVGHLAKLLRQIDRNDAVVVLAKLKPSPHVQLVL
ncbi:IGF-like family receptor 1 [Nothobranchius furzeri]|uniref:IGF-like family receptor 1 n=1 Tax=Nothobranchius furzeri TaxID=105023 RepID=A0A1A7ZT86_NOTFU